MKKNTFALLAGVTALALTPVVSFSEDATYDTYKERYAVDIPGGGSVWLGIKDAGNSHIDGDILWGGGSVVPVHYVGETGEDGGYVVQRPNQLVLARDNEGNVTRRLMPTDSYIFQITGNFVDGTAYMINRNQKGIRVVEFSGKKLPALPSAPDLSKVKYGEPVELFNGKDLSGWKLTSDNATNGWVVEDGVLENRPKQEPGKPHVSYGNLRTEAVYEDFNISMDVNVPKDGNSGVYLRGVYEVQVMDSYGRGLDSHNMGAVYSRITPSESAEKPAGEWQTLDITLCDKHVTVILNGKKIIDNHPVLGCTGGALWSDDSKPGPIYLQGDHDYVKYKNVVLKPIVKE